MSLIYFAGFDFLPLTVSGWLDRRSLYSRLGWTDFATGPAASSVRYESRNTNPTPAFGYGRCLRINTLVNALAQISKPFPDFVARDELFVGCRMFSNDAVNVTLNPYVGFSYFGERVMRVVFRAFGVLQVRNSAGILWQSPPGVHTSSTWNHVELGFKLTNDSTGWMTLKLNGKPLVQLVSQVTQGTGSLVANMVTVGYLNEAPVGWGSVDGFADWDDLYVTDALGVRNVGFLGNARVQALLPDGNDTVTWDVEPLTNANWQSARNAFMNDDAYVSSPVIGDQDKYTIEPMVNTPEVFGVQVTGVYRQDDATQRSVVNVIDSGGTEEEGVEYFTPGNYASSVDLFETDPDTTVSWLPGAVNALRVGPKVKS